MSTIFHRASYVYIWLGELYASGHVITDRIEGFESIMRKRAYDGSSLIELLESLPRGVKRHIWRLGDSPYWRRVWIVQELVLGYGLHVFWGITQFPGYSLRLLRNAAQHFEKARAAEKASGFLTSLVMSPMGKLIHLVDLGKARSKRLELWLLVVLYGSNNATDPRDKIYGLLGLAKEPIEVDYSKTLEAVYRSALGSMQVQHRASYELVIGKEKSNVLPNWRVVAQGECPITRDEVSLFFMRDVHVNEVLEWMDSGLVQTATQAVAADSSALLEEEVPEHNDGDAPGHVSDTCSVSSVQAECGRPDPPVRKSLPTLSAEELSRKSLLGYPIHRGGDNLRHRVTPSVGRFFVGAKRRR